MKKQQMKNKYSKFIKLKVAGLAISAVIITACGATDNKNTATNDKEVVEETKELPFFTDIENDDLVVLFTTDVHHKLTEYMGYDGLVNVRKKVEDIVSEDNLIMVDCGDCLDGGELGENTKGMGIADIMDYVGVDAAVPGNHDFKYGVDALKQIAKNSSFKYLSCNLRKIDGEELVLQPYTVIEKAGKKIGIVGVTTPKGTFSYEGCTDFASSFDDISVEGAPVYDLSENIIFEQVQKSVDDVRNEGADYVILVSHLGRDIQDYSSVEMIRKTTGIDAVIDGHEHIEIDMETHENAEGENVILTSSGEYIGAVGKLVIKSDGNISSSLLSLSEYQEKDEETTDYINQALDGTVN